jgi:hypothetical protein
MPKFFFDFIRWFWILGATGYAVKWLWSIHWALGLFLALPVFIISINVIGFLTLPLYLFTTEAQSARKILKDFKEKRFNSKSG